MEESDGPHNFGLGIISMTILRRPRAESFPVHQISFWLPSWTSGILTAEYNVLVRGRAM